MKNNKIRDIVLIVVSVVIGGVFTYLIIGGDRFVSSNNNSSLGSSCNVKNCTKVVVDETGLSEAVSKVYDGVVLVRNYQNNEVASTGTGFVYKMDKDYAYIITNQHVVASANKISIVTSKDKEIDGEVLGGDSYVDIAVIKVKKDKNLIALTLGNSSNSKLGEIVFTVGNPLGYEYRGSVSTGHLAGKDRLVSVNTSGSTSGTGDWVMKVLQTDAAINPGNSGGPLFNVNGEVIGVISLKLVKTEVEGMGFAIPIEYVNSKIETLEKGEKIEWPLLGVQMVSVADVKRSYVKTYNVPEGVNEGVIVAGIVEGSAAANSDLKTGDIITKLAGVKVSDTAYLRYELYKHEVGKKIEITFLRDGKEKKTTVELTKSNN